MLGVTWSTAVRLGVVLALASTAGCGSLAPVVTGVGTEVRGGPLVFRLTGDQRGSGQVPRQYAMVWRLSRDPCTKLSYSRLGTAGAAGRCGNYGIVGFEMARDFDLGKFDLPNKQGSECFGAFLDLSPATAVRSRLDRIPEGHRASAYIQPFDPPTSGNDIPPLGKLNTSHPKMRAADFRLRNRSARRALQSIGC